MAFVNGLLGVAEARRGRLDEARGFFDAARDEYREIGETDHVSEIDGMWAECLVLAGRSEEAAELARRLLDEGPGGPQVPMLHRVVGLAALYAGDLEEARAALEASLEAARERGAEHEVALTLDVMAECLRPDVPEFGDACHQRDALFAQLGITDGGRLSAFGN